MAMAHISPDEAVQAMKDLNATSALGIHWGTFEMTKEALDQPPKDLAIALQAEGVSAEKFFVLKQGETKKIVPRK
jgi:N-acyl-phosphatidylethanolamine-hydrolysing phospholipase D